MAGKSGTWTPERRIAHAQWMRENKPWLKSTGPKTVEGKARVRLNAQKHARRSAPFLLQLKILRRLLRMQRDYLRRYKIRHALHTHNMRHKPDYRNASNSASYTAVREPLLSNSDCVT